MAHITSSEYHSGPGISKSMLDAIAISPLYYWDLHVNPKRQPREYKHCFSIGDGTHKLVLEPGTFENTYAVDFDKSEHPDALDTIADLKKACGDMGLPISGSKPELVERLIGEADFPAERIMFKLEQSHRETMTERIPIKAREYRDMLSSLEKIDTDPIASSLIRGGAIEQSFFWTDERGILRKCRPDIVTSNGQCIVDLKTTDDVSPKGFGKTIVNRRYHVQAAWYLDVMTGLYGHDAPQAFVFIAAQKTRPYDVGVLYLTPDQIELGRQTYREDLDRLVECMKDDVWPGATGGKLVEAVLPDWAMRKISAALSLGENYVSH